MEVTPESLAKLLQLLERHRPVDPANWMDPRLVQQEHMVRVYLLLRRCISWHTPVFFVGTAAAFASVLWATDPSANMHPAFHVLTGGLMLGAVFMATDIVTTPVTAGGKALFGIGCGAMTMVIRKWGSLPEGVSFAILIMNALTPLIDRITRPRVFGHRAFGKGSLP